jgi:two-component system sensor histidine kinase/response regulator
MRSYTILIVDDDPRVPEVISPALEREGYQVATSRNGESAIELLCSKEFNLVITDISVGRVGGIDILRKSKAVHPETVVVILTGRDESHIIIDALRWGADDYILKPFELADLTLRISQSLEKYDLRREKLQTEADQQLRNERILSMTASMSHDIRGSLVSLATALRLLNRGFYGQMDDGVAAKLDDLHMRTRQIIGMAEDYLGKSFTVNGELEIEKQLLDLRRDIVTPVMEEFSTEIGRCRITVDNRLDCIPRDRIPLKGNIVWLKTVFRNLLKNAIKYGGKECTISIGISDCPTHYRLNVFNSGRPVPQEYRDKLFSKFVRLSNGRKERNTDGIGLGLYLTKSIIQKHGGDIWYDATNRGSNFVFILPRE